MIESGPGQTERDLETGAPQADLDAILHYTSLEGAKGIRASTCVSPGRSGQVFLTREVFPTGAPAGWFLAIWPAKRIIGGVVIQSGLVPDAAGGKNVEQLVDEFGRQIRGGGALEWWVDRPVDLDRFGFVRTDPPRSPEDGGFSPGSPLPDLLRNYTPRGS